MSARFSCAEVERFGDAWLDGEFATDDKAALEAHLLGCMACAEQLRRQAAFRRAVRDATPRPQAPSLLREKIVAAVARERTPHPLRSMFSRSDPGGPDLRNPGRGSWRLAGAVAAAALALGLWRAQTIPVGAGRRDGRVEMADLIAPLQRDWPMEVRGSPDTVRAWFNGKVGFPVRPPQMPPGAVLVGARLAHVRDRDAAMLLYQLGAERVAVLVFDTGPGFVIEPRSPPSDPRYRRSFGQREVFLDGQRGYHVAAFRDRDLTYSFTSDMDQDRMIQLVSVAVER